MALANLLIGSHIASFKDIDLHKNIQTITDQRGPRLVVHNFPYRDGGKVETLGSKPNRTTWTLIFNGADWVDQIRRVEASIANDPSGILIHPIYGQMRVVCEGFPSSVVNVPEALNSVSVTLSFVEDVANLGFAETIGIASLQATAEQAVFDAQAKGVAKTKPKNLGQILALVGLGLGGQGPVLAILAAINKFTTAASNVIDSLFTVAITDNIDPSIPAKMIATGTALAELEVIYQSEFFTLQSTAQNYDAIVAAEVAYSACLDLQDAVSLQTSGYFSYVVPGPTSIAVLAGYFYGQGALSFIDQILGINRIPDPTNIPTGTVLTLPPIPSMPIVASLGIPNF